MSTPYRLPPRKLLQEFIIFALSQSGQTIADMERARGKMIPGDGSQVGYKAGSVWWNRTELIQYVATELKLHQSLWGINRTSSEFYNAMDQEIAKLRQKTVIVDWNGSRHMGIFRLNLPSQAIKRPIVSMNQTPAQSLDRGTNSMKHAFLSILRKGRKDNTYKFALARALIEHCRDNPSSVNGIYEIPYNDLASKFLEYYWYQERKFRIKQDFKTKSTPQVIQAIRKVFDGSKEVDFDKVNDVDKKKAERYILKTVFGTAKSKTSLVVPKFQKVMEGINAVENKIFYDYDDDKKLVYLKAEAFDFFKSNHGILSGVVLAEWAKFLERINGSLPRLVAKIEQYDPERGILTPYRKVYLEHTHHCFYCRHKLEHNYIHVDHFIPWSYIFEDEAWNLVLACPNCNLKKHNSLPQTEFQNTLITRNQRYRDRIQVLDRSLRQIDTKIGWEDEIKNHYTNCMEYGFNVIKMP